MKLSVVIPYYYRWEGKPAILARAVESLHGHDELIVVGHKSESISWALNTGISASHGQYVLIMNDDMYLNRGSLDHLCQGMYVTHPMVNEQAEAFGSALCIPRPVFDEVGLYDEVFREAYYEDDDIIRRIETAGFERRVVRSVNLCHPQVATSIRPIGDSAGDFAGENKAYFLSKWGDYTPVQAPPFLEDE